MNITPDIAFLETSMSISFQQASQFDKYTNGLVHRKTVPNAIIVQPLRGWYTVSCCGRTFDAHPGATVLIPANTEVAFTHHGSGDNPMWAQWLHISCLLFGAIDLSSLLNIPLSVCGRPNRTFGSIIRELLQLSSEPSIRAAFRRKEIGFAALRCLCECSTFRDESSGFVRRAERLRPVFRYMTEHIEDDCSVVDFARIACLSPSRFFAFFKGVMKVSPMTYFRRLRIAEASKMLLMTDQSISRVADECGFANQFHFSKFFKENTGTSPTEYRKRIF